MTPPASALSAPVDQACRNSSSVDSTTVLSTSVELNSDETNSGDSSQPWHWHYWGLTQEPFHPVLRWPEEEALIYHSGSWQEATARLQYVIEYQFGLAILSGPSGAGKSLLLTAAADQLAQQGIRPLKHACYPDVDLQRAPLGTPADWETEHLLSVCLHHEPCCLTGRYALLIDQLEQAQVSAETLQRLAQRALQERSLGCVILVVDQQQAATVYEQLSGFAPLMMRLEAYQSWETEQYLQHRFQRAGGSVTLFETEAAELLHQHTRGLPRQLNRFAHECLLFAAMKEKTEIDRALVQEVLNSIQKRSFAPHLNLTPAGNKISTHLR